jgi:hypothetical protein
MVGPTRVILVLALNSGAGAAGMSTFDQAVEHDVHKVSVVDMRVLAFTPFSRDQTKILTQQIEQIWRLQGITIRWACENEDDCLRVVLVEQRGFVAADRQQRYACLGSIPFLASGPVKTLYVAVNRLRDLVRESTHFNTPDAVRELLVARAAGRAAAHELAHYLLATPEHAPSGLLRSTFSSSDLLGAFLEPFLLTDQQGKSLRLEAPTQPRCR